MSDEGGVMPSDGTLGCPTMIGNSLIGQRGSGHLVVPSVPDV